MQRVMNAQLVISTASEEDVENYPARLSMLGELLCLWVSAIAFTALGSLLSKMVCTPCRDANETTRRQDI